MNLNKSLRRRIICIFHWRSGPQIPEKYEYHSQNLADIQRVWDAHPAKCAAKSREYCTAGDEYVAKGPV